MNTSKSFNSYSQDCLFGATSESDNMSSLVDYAGKLERLSRYHPFDFEGQDIFIELKSRNMTHNHHSTTLIPMSKINACTNPLKKYVFAFKFTDGLYLIEYDKESFSAFAKIKFVRNSREGIKDIVQDYLLIPIEKLIKIK